MKDSLELFPEDAFMGKMLVIAEEYSQQQRLLFEVLLVERGEGGAVAPIDKSPANCDQ
jgi:hypothetical protein